jgi:hypothetical protein
LHGCLGRNGHSWLDWKGAGVVGLERAFAKGRGLVVKNDFGSGEGGVAADGRQRSHSNITAIITALY